MNQALIINSYLRKYMTQSEVVRWKAYSVWRAMLAPAASSQDVTAVIKHSSAASDINPFENSNNVVY